MPTCPAVVPLCGTKAEVTVPSLDDWEKEWERAENVKSGKLKCATKVVPGEFPVAGSCHRTIELAAMLAGSEIVSKVRTDPFSG
jgi:hypothetical protein